MHLHVPHKYRVRTLLPVLKQRIPRPCYQICEVLLIVSSLTLSGDETRQRVKFSDERVCKSHLLNCCPHDILSGTVSVQQLLL